MSIVPITPETDTQRDPRGGAPSENDPRRCTAHLSDGSGERCRQWSMQGQGVCGKHGGKTPAAIRRAQLNLMDLLPVATKKHREILETSEDERVVLQAVKMVYDRTGLQEGSAAADTDAVKQMIVSRLMDLRGSLPDPEDLPPIDEDIVDAEVIEDQPSDNDEDLI